MGLKSEVTKVALHAITAVISSIKSEWQCQAASESSAHKELTVCKEHLSSTVLESNHSLNLCQETLNRTLIKLERFERLELHWIQSIGVFFSGLLLGLLLALLWPIAKSLCCFVSKPRRSQSKVPIESGNLKSNSPAAITYTSVPPSELRKLVDKSAAKEKSPATQCPP